MPYQRGIQIRWIDIVDHTIVLRKSNTKGKKSPEKYQFRSLIEDIKRLPNEGAYLFSGRNGQGPYP